MTRPEFEAALMTTPFSNRELRLHEAAQRQVIEQLRHEIALLKQDDAERCTLIRDMEEEERRKDAVIENLKQDLVTAERALQLEGYRKECDIPACNCGAQWRHGGYAAQRLSEISNAVPFINGTTVLDRVQILMQQIATLREALKDKDDDVRHLMASVMQLATTVRGSIVTSEVTQSILFKAEHLLKVIGEKQALKEVKE